MATWSLCWQLCIATRAFAFDVSVHHETGFEHPDVHLDGYTLAEVSLAQPHMFRVCDARRRCAQTMRAEVPSAPAASLCPLPGSRTSMTASCLGSWYSRYSPYSSHFISLVIRNMHCRTTKCHRTLSGTPGARTRSYSWARTHGCSHIRAYAHMPRLLVHGTGNNSGGASTRQPGTPVQRPSSPP